MRCPLRFAAIAALLLPLASLPACRDASSARDVASGAASRDALRRTLRDLVSEHWERELRISPEYASILGDKRYNDRWSDYSEKAALDDLEVTRQHLARLAAIDPAGFPEQERLDHALLKRNLELTVEGARFELWLMPVNQFYGAHSDPAELVPSLSFASVKDYEDYLTRLRAIPTLLEQATLVMRKGASRGIVPARMLLGHVADQANALASPSEDSPFAAPLKKFSDAIPEADRARLRDACLAAIRDQVAPAYRRFAEFVRTEYEPRGRPEPGVWSLPDGEARYEFAIKQFTTTTMTAAEIHALGLREVARSEAEMLGVAKRLGHANLKSFAAAIASDPALHFASRNAILDRYRKYTDAMMPKLPSLFGRLPKATLEILPVEEFREKQAAGAQYVPGTPDGSRPGHVMVNTGDYANRTTLAVETTAYHEGVPGHHLQMTIAQEITGLSPYRQHYSVTAFMEGWALYAERLGEEVGMYEDPYSLYGHLQDEMLRAIRLVADTGYHAKRWTRQQVVDFFHAHATMDEPEVQAETDRYAAAPGQALAYKIGQLRILALREKAKKALGARFDVRAFHDMVLGAGALPLDVLERQVDAWIAARRTL
jgi:uncharacterized protein (DUF885 family)